MTPIHIHKGDDTVFGEVTKFLTFKLISPSSLEEYKAEFRLRGIFKKIDSLDNGEFEVILKAEETNKLEYGKCFGELKLIDPEGNIKTVCNIIPFVITPKVISTQEGVIELDLMDNPEYVLNVTVGNKPKPVNYESLTNIPTLNGVKIVGDLTSEDLEVDIDTSNLVTKEELENKGYLTEHQDISNLVTKEELEDKGYLTEHQDISNLVTKEELEDKGYLTEADIDIDTSNLVTKEELENKGYLTEADLDIDTSNLVTKEELENKGYLTEHQSLDHLVTKKELENKGYLTEADIDTSNLVTKDELENKGYLTEHQDISHLATKEEVNRLVEEFGSILDEINGEII